MLRFSDVRFLDRDYTAFLLLLIKPQRELSLNIEKTTTEGLLGRSAIYPRLIWLLKCTHHQEIMLSK